MKNSAGVTFNENTDLIIEADPTGEVTSCRNIINGVEYVGGGGEEKYITLFDGSVVTEEYDGIYSADLDFFLDAEEIKVIYDDVEYTCEKITSNEGVIFYGGIDENYGLDFTVYPFAMMFMDVEGVNERQIVTKTVGSHTLIIKIAEPVIKIIRVSVTVDENSSTYGELNLSNVISGNIINAFLINASISQTYNVAIVDNQPIQLTDLDGDVINANGDIEFDESVDKYNISGDCEIIVKQNIGQ